MTEQVAHLRQRHATFDEPSGPGKPCAEIQFSPKVLDLIMNWTQKH
jgi:hypothetical protein